MAGASNVLWFGDNLEVLQDHIADDSADLVYLDPPFNSQRAYNVIYDKHPDDPDAAAQYKAFEDTWHWTVDTHRLRDRLARAEGVPERVAAAVRAFGTLLPDGDRLAYLVNMAPRLAELHRVLKPGGSLYLHCDPTMSHYLKILLDSVFGPENFRNEIAWKRSSAHNSAKRYGPVHDVLLFYTSGRRYTWNRVYQAMPQETIDGWYDQVEPGTNRRYHRGDLTAPGVRAGPSGEPWRGINPTTTGRHWAVPQLPLVAGLPTQQALDVLDDAGLVHWPKKEGGRPRVKVYLDASRGVAAQDVITDIGPLGNGSDERRGYQTQKPRVLLERIISASSNPGDVVLDPFCGCGTTIDAAQRLGRNWIGIDIAYIAIDIIIKRLRGDSASAATYDLRGIPRDMRGADALFAKDPFEFQTWAVTQLDAEPTEQRSRDKGIDGVATFHLDRERTGRAIVSVKGGGTVVPADVRDLLGTVTAQRAQLGVFVMRSKPTRGILEAAREAGTYTWPFNGQAYPVIQVITVGQMIAGLRPALPPIREPYGRKPRRRLAVDAASLLAGRVLVHARAADGPLLLELASARHSGLVLTGTDGARVTERIRRDRGIDCPVVLDPASYMTWKATPQDPFRVAAGPLRGRALDDFLHGMYRAGAHAVLTPTCYIGEGDAESLDAVLKAAPGLGAQAIVSLPLDIAWASSKWVEMLVDMMRKTHTPKALMFTSYPPRPRMVREIVANLRLIAAEVPRVGLFRSGLGVFDLTARGALTGSVGASRVMRTVTAPGGGWPGEQPDEEGRVPEVLVRDLLTYLPSEVVGTRLGGGVGVCHCRHCGGLSLTRITGRAQWKDARLHGVAVWAELLPGLLAEASPDQRQDAWRRLCCQALDAYSRLGGTDGAKLQPPVALKAWAGEPVSSAAAERRLQLRLQLGA
jgi:site-specific DNA-methyltransferase (adenine-specific)